MGTIKKTVKNIKDTITEGMHRGEAMSEREKRATMGDVMTPGEKTESVVHEVAEDSKAGIDRLKRDVRNI
jgi:gas vesicle protein